MKNIKLNYKLSEEQKHHLGERLLQNRGLLFLLVVGAFSVYTFNLIYRKAYVEVNFIQYAAGTTNFSGTHQGLQTLEKMIQHDEERKQGLEQEKTKSYRDPFAASQGAAGNAGAGGGASSPEPAAGTGSNVPSYRPKS